MGDKLGEEVGGWDGGNGGGLGEETGWVRTDGPLDTGVHWDFDEGSAV